jgi:predicted RNase H-like nuclease
LYVLDEHGASAESDYLYSHQSIANFVAQRADANGNVLVIDAPLICINEKGQRTSEKLVGKHYGRFHASCHSSNTRIWRGNADHSFWQSFEASFRSLCGTMPEEHRLICGLL